MVMPAAHALMQAAEDVPRAVEGLTVPQLWALPGGAAAVGGVKIAPGIAQKARAGGKTATAQHLVVIEPGLRVLFIGSGSKARIWTKAGCGPLPDISDHLPATEHAFAG